MENSARKCHSFTPISKQKIGEDFPFTLAAPSFVIPAGAAENARFLADFFSEIGLLFFETEACLKYSEADLPPDLASLPISWHVHLPLDLPWDKGIAAVWDILSKLLDKAAFLSPRTWVLHPPTQPNLLVPLADRFRAYGLDPIDILLENVEETNLAALWPEARSAGYSTCLDLGHIMAYNQYPLLELDGLWESTRMLHIYAPIHGSRHTGLTHLDEEGKALLRLMLSKFRGDTVTLEVFDETEIFQSIETLIRWMSQWSTQN
ncbi:cobamide remodeling phosphodiesterase CbiR [Pseudodesulfovibrio piezophilus]|uniref:Xylose isomerase domain protein TIM barrel n=1 Tax=Pseudodesulfovibrio piezophilus (strain DSM 21447 / JCM 15486 / C1TLV30) TaxID=1322246 RepID=M1WPE0_PSEP2|nr:cobamide remodeling phosphodiesterase CbiR [Pseudodesulfovibrio piezophilus]CCH48289.1 conserved protein of unknown function [Pseudodesulfovibrio piezophilus C1TLV30]